MGLFGLVSYVAFAKNTRRSVFEKSLVLTQGDYCAPGLSMDFLSFWCFGCFGNWSGIWFSDSVGSLCKSNRADHLANFVIAILLVMVLATLTIAIEVGKVFRLNAGY